MGTARVQGQRDVALNELAFRGIAINDATANTAAVQVYASDSGIFFVNKFASATTYTLPAVAEGAGKWFWFFNVGAAGMIIASYGSLDDIIAVNDIAADTVTYATANLMIGSACLVIGDGTNWYAMNIGATTVTVA